MNKKIMSLLIGIALLSFLAARACSDNTPVTCKTAGNAVNWGIPFFYNCKLWSDGTAGRCVDGYGGDGATCVNATVPCGYYKWYSCADNLPDTTRQYVSEDYSSTKTSGSCGGG